jgi:glycerol kinase
VLFGTVDTWLLWNLCAGRPHVTDETNAARTVLFDIQDFCWSDRLLQIFGIPRGILPTVLPSRGVFGILKQDVLGARVPVLAVCGDQQASTYAAMRVQHINKAVVTKVTYGTGVFVVQVLGRHFALHPPFFTTLVPAIGMGSFYALEGKIEGSAQTVDRLLSNIPKLFRYFRQLTKQVRGLVKKFPVKPSEIVVDGGIARDGYIVEIQQEILGIPACLQDPFDGTALGCALLVWDAIH